MRYNEQAVQPPKEPNKEEAPREMPKQGQYTREDLSKARNIVWRK